MGVWSTNYLFGNMLDQIAGRLPARGAMAGAGRSGAAPCLPSRSGGCCILWQRNRPQDAGLEPIIDEQSTEGRAVQASQADRVTFRQYAQLATNPIILAMGASYFCIKFLRYALDSWLPAFLNVQGLDVARASYYSQVFDFAGAGRCAPGRLGAGPLVQGQLGRSGRLHGPRRDSGLLGSDRVWWQPDGDGLLVWARGIYALRPGHAAVRRGLGSGRRREERRGGRGAGQRHGQHRLRGPGAGHRLAGPRGCTQGCGTPTGWPWR